jgi:EAL domain-containing protein (putative c-di-GMP-specific phosphodiesterase class I)/ActR/RegA family two-component response regulator
LGSASLLIVDDDPVLTGFVERVARRAGLEVRTAHGAREIWTEGAPDPDLVFLDLNMADTDGLAVLRELAARASRARIYVMSGADPRILRSATRLAEELGLDVGEPLAKPVQLAELMEIFATTVPAAHPGRPAPSLRPSGPAFSVEELERAIDHAELHVDFQPILRLGALEPVGVEALVRWRHPTRGLVPPLAFVPLIEAAGLGARMTEGILRQAAALLTRDELRHAAQPLSVSVNVGPAALAERGFADRVGALLADSRVDSSRLVVEVTESVVEANRLDVLEALNRLRLRGCFLSVDDFGTGTSSLERVEQLPCTELKIERAFVNQVERREHAGTIVRTTIDLARRLGLRTVGEGIETPAVLSWLREAGCDLGQGYLFSRPLAADALIAWLESWPARRATLGLTA